MGGRQSVKQRKVGVVDVLAANPEGAQKLVESFVRRAQQGLEVGFLRSKPPPIDAELTLSTDLQTLQLRVAGRERKVELCDVKEIAAGIEAEGREEAVPMRKCATL